MQPDLGATRGDVSIAARAADRCRAVGRPRASAARCSTLASTSPRSRSRRCRERRRRHELRPDRRAGAGRRQDRRVLGERHGGGGGAALRRRHRRARHPPRRRARTAASTTPSRRWRRRRHSSPPIPGARRRSSARCAARSALLAEDPDACDGGRRAGLPAGAGGADRRALCAARPPVLRAPRSPSARSTGMKPLRARAWTARRRPDLRADRRHRHRQELTRDAGQQAARRVLRASTSTAVGRRRPAIRTESSRRSSPARSTRRQSGHADAAAAIRPGRLHHRAVRPRVLGGGLPRLRRPHRRQRRRRERRRIVLRRTPTRAGPRARSTAHSSPRAAVCCWRSTTSIPCEAGARATRRRSRERTHHVGAARRGVSGTHRRRERRGPADLRLRRRDRRPAAARAMDGLRQAGAEPSPYAGIPISVKDVFDVRGQVTRAGSRVLAGVPRRGTRPRSRVCDAPVWFSSAGRHDGVRVQRARDQPARRNARQPVGARAAADSRRIVVGGGGLGRRRDGARRGRHRHRRLVPNPRGALRPRRVQAHAGPRSRRRRGAALTDARHRRRPRPAASAAARCSTR